MICKIRPFSFYVSYPKATQLKYVPPLAFQIEIQVLLSNRGGNKHRQSLDLVQGEDTRTAWTVIGKHLVNHVNSHVQPRPDPSHTKTGEIIQTLSLNVHPVVQVT